MIDNLELHVIVAAVGRQHLAIDRDVVLVHQLESVITARFCRH